MGSACATIGAVEDEETIGDRLRTLLAESNLPIRMVARRIAGTDTDQRKIENARRKLNNCLGGSQPDPAFVAEIEVALGIDPGELERFRSSRERRAAGLAVLEARVTRIDDRVARLEEAMREAALLRAAASLAAAREVLPLTEDAKDAPGVGEGSARSGRARTGRRRAS